MNTIKVGSIKLSEIACEYINSHCSNYKKSYRNHFIITLKYIEYWMNQKQLTLETLKPEHIETFECDLMETGLKLGTRNGMRFKYQRYFLWLEKRRLLQSSAKSYFPIRINYTPRRYDADLPPEARRFIAVSETQVKTGTVNVHKSILRYFYTFLRSNNLKIKKITRADMENFLIYLFKDCTAQSTRRYKLHILRAYLRQLHLSGFLKTIPETLIKPMDIPKLVKLLPRPLSLELDKTIQERLKASPNLLHKGLLLMRKTGIRVGELTSLRYDCLKTDINSYSFLKVELGKLDTERLVPLHEDTVKLIQSIQAKTKEYKNSPEKLILLESGKMPITRHYMLAFNDITRGLYQEKPIVSHQLRHTFACEMLNCGMSLIALKDILGHKDIHMTLQYAAVAQGTVRDEFLKAYNLISKQYELPKPHSEPVFDPMKAMSDLVDYFKNQSSIKLPNQKDLKLITRRLKRIKQELMTIFKIEYGFD